MCDDLENMIPFHGPGEINLASSITRVVDFMSICKDHAFARRDRPNDRDVVLFSATCRSGLSRVERGTVGKSKAPAKHSSMYKQTHNE